jgi:hypothetical protein
MRKKIDEDDFKHVMGRVMVEKALFPGFEMDNDFSH